MDWSPNNWIPTLLRVRATMACSLLRSKIFLSRWIATGVLKVDPWDEATVMDR